MSRRASTEVIYRDKDGNKQCFRCKDWLPGFAFPKNRTASDGLHANCGRCHRDARHNFLPHERQAFLLSQKGACLCGAPFDVLGGKATNYTIDHDHEHCRKCAGPFSCGKSIRALLCNSCNVGNTLGPDMSKAGSSSKYRGVSLQRGKWLVSAKIKGQSFSPASEISGWAKIPCAYEDEDDAGEVAALLREHLRAR